MRYDPDLADRLGAFPTDRFKGEVFRATRKSADPVAPSLSGGRWARPQSTDDPGTSVLYTSMERDGAMAEVASVLADQSPVPGSLTIKVTRLAVTTSRTFRLVSASLAALGVDMSRYGERDYARTQEIGSTLAWLGLDGLIAPSARWTCESLMIFTDNHNLREKLESIGEEFVEWRQWAQQHGVINGTEP
ncbi:MAG: RES family NAD+ phosphorylase [Alphaproteobacteria bacterium]